MNILFLAPRLPLPADTGGKIRTMNILKQMLKFSNVHFVCFSFDAGDQEWKKEIEKWGVQVTLVSAGQPAFIQKAWNVSMGALPHSIIKYGSPFMQTALEHLSKSRRFNAVHIDHLHMAQYTKLFKGLPCFLDEHNVEYRILERCAQVEPNFLKKQLYKQQSSKMKVFESQKINECQGILACSDDDRKILNNLLSSARPVHVIPNGVDTAYFNTDSQKAWPAEDSLVFTGSMDWLPNTDAIVYFCDKVLPLIWQKKDSVKLYVVGKNASNLIKDLAKHDPRIIVTGYVDDVRPYIRRSTVFVAPLRIGGGTRLKILEAMAMGKAVVSTTIGAEGIEYTRDKNIILADDPKGFAEKVLYLLDNPPKSIEIATQARGLVCSRYDWNIIGQKLKDIYTQTAYVQ
jgi:sugar transferase (PEP-CTERM/EpsH1 system associated)